MSSIELMTYLTDEEVDNIYKRLYANNFDILREEKIDLIFNAYKDKSFIGLLLTDEELDFLKNNINRSNLSENFRTIDLANVGILVKDELGRYLVPDELVNYIKQGLEFYYQNSNIEEFKKNSYIITAVLRIKGALMLKDLKRYLEPYINDVNKALKIYFSMPYYHRFFKKVSFRSRIYITYQELTDKSDLSFVKFQRNDDEIIYDILELVEIGKHYFIYDSDIYDDIMKSLSSAFILNKSNRTDMYIFAGEGNYNYDTYLDKDIINEMKIEEYDSFDDFMRLLPSFTPTDENALFWDAYDYKCIVEYTHDLYDFSSRYYGVKIDPSLDDPLKEIMEKMNYDGFSSANELINYLGKDILEDELDFLEAVSRTSIEDYVVYKETNNGIYLIDSLGKIYIAKLPLDSLIHERGIQAHHAKMSLVGYHNRILIFTYTIGKRLTKEEKKMYDKLFKENEDEVISKI